MIKGIVFDCYGVLVHGSLGYLRTLVPSERRPAFDELSHASDRGIVTAEEYIAGAAELLNLTADDVSDIIIKREIRSEAMVSYVKSLRDKYKIALLSNVGRGAIDRLFTPGELEELFDAVVLSSEIGITKPMREAYETAAGRLGLSAEECLMVDDIGVNVEGAKQAGMQAILFEDPEQCETAIMQFTKDEHA